MVNDLQLSKPMDNHIARDLASEKNMKISQKTKDPLRRNSFSAFMML